MKLIDKLRSAASEGRPFYSFEYFPPKTEAGIENLYARIERMGRLEPAFVDVTWGAGGSTAELTFELASTIENVLGLETMMHLTCTNMPRRRIAAVLEDCRARGIGNILALRGDPPRGRGSWSAVADGFAHASDLVRFIRQEHGDYFGICVGGYPEGHPEASSRERDLDHLAEKVATGADFVITQMFYEPELYLRFVDGCRERGISCPLVPGLAPINGYQSFQRITGFGASAPPEIVREIEARRFHDASVREYGQDVLTDICRRLLDGGAPGLHFYTLNLERSVQVILRRLGIVPEHTERVLPWRSATAVRRPKEEVRPIFWANRPKSYLARTQDWDEFPNGRWGDSGSPAFGDLADHHLAFRPIKPDVARERWGRELASIDQVRGVFAGFCRGEVNGIPWYDWPLELESEPLRNALEQLNLAGLLTINSQPRVDGAPSDDPAVGWGGAGGHVYQKAYLEFFLAPEQVPPLLGALEASESLTYHAIDRSGAAYSNCDTVNAVTWGVFPGGEVRQPTIVDPRSFEVWKDEAFDLWLSSWAAVYEEDSESRRLLQRIHDTYFLVNVVDNDYVDGDLLGFLLEAVGTAQADEPPSITIVAPVM